MQLNNIDESGYPLDINNYISTDQFPLNKNIIIPLIYSIIENHEYYNVILIHDKINNPQEFALYANSKSLSIIYNESSSNDELIELLNKYFTNIKRIAFVFHNTNIDSLKEFTNNKPLFDYNDLEINTIDYSLNMQFIINIANQFNVQNLDYLACNTLLYEHWKKYFDILKGKTNATIGASNDETGNIKYGGDWVLENTNEDIRNIYFTDSVENYQYTLAESTLTQNGGTITLNQDSSTLVITCTLTSETQTITSSNWPVRINNTSTTNGILTVVFNTNIILNSDYGDINGYFIFGTNNITINGNNKTVNIGNIQNYLGLFQNGTVNDSGVIITTGFTNITIEKLGVATTTSTLILTFPYGGWICQSSFGAGTLSGNITVNNCYSNGNINTACGGIFGVGAGRDSSSTITTTNCYSTGSIGSVAGGIFGFYAGDNSSATITTTNCYSTGTINGGGIFAPGAGRNSSSTISTTNCYSTGSIGDYGGGIFGITAGNNSSTTISATNCYSTGIIGSSGGGIFGQNAQTSAKAINCYSIGTITTSTNGIFGSGTRGTTENCYSTNGVENWNDTTALSSLIYSPDVWTDINSNPSTPWLLSTFNANIYNPDSYTGNSNPGLFQPNYIYSIIKVNDSYTIPSNISINTGTGIITFTSPITSYIVKVLVSKGTSPNNYEYNINTFTYIYTTPYTNPWLLSSFNANIYNPNSYSGNSTFTTDQGLFQPNYTYSIITVNGSYTIPNNISITANDGIIQFTNPTTTYIVKVLVGKIINAIYYQYNTGTFTYTYVN